MSDSRRRILEMLAEKRISVDEAERLLAVLQADEGKEQRESREKKGSPKYLRVEVKPNPDNLEEVPGKVNIRVPMNLLRAGMKLAAVIPPGVYNQVDAALKEKGIEMDLRNIKPENIEELILALNDLEIDVEDGKQTIHVYAE